MASRNPAAPAASKTPGTAMVRWADTLKARAALVRTAEAKSAVGGGGIPRLNVQTGHLYIGDQLIKDNALDIVIVASLHQNTFFHEKYAPDTPSIPDCYAYSTFNSADPEATMAAHPEAPDRQGGADHKCVGCEHNEFGTADGGTRKGKACGNYRLLAFYKAEDLLAEAFDPANSKAELHGFKVSVTSVKNWARYTQALADEHELPPEGVVTRITVTPDKRTQFQIHFEEAGIVEYTEPLWDFVEKSGKRAYGELATVYRLIDEEEEEKPIKATGRLADKLKGKKVAPPAKKPAAKKPVVRRK